MDEAYNSVDVYGRGGPEFLPALRVAVTVIGRSSACFAITDGGSKSFALDGPPPRVFLGDAIVGQIEWCGDEFGRVLPERGLDTLPIDAVVECTAPHCDPTINLDDFLRIVSGDRLEFWNSGELRLADGQTDSCFALRIVNSLFAACYRPEQESALSATQAMEIVSYFR